MMIVGVAAANFAQMTAATHRVNAITESRNIAYEQMRATMEAARAAKFNTLGFSTADAAPGLGPQGEQTVALAAGLTERSSLLTPTSTFTRSGIEFTQEVAITWHNTTAADASAVSTGARTKRITVTLTWIPRGATAARSLTYDMTRTPTPSEERTHATVNLPEHSL